MRIDHVIYGVSDLPAGMSRFAERYGLRAVEGGRHPQLGTCNAIVPLADRQYIELMAVADPTSTHPVARGLAALTATADRLVAVCVEPEDLDGVAARLGLGIVAGERQKPTGEVIRWRMAGVEKALAPPRMPFFVDWLGGSPGADPGINAEFGGIAWVSLGGKAAPVEYWLGENASTVPLRFEDGPDGPLAIAVRRGSGEVVVS